MTSISALAKRTQKFTIDNSPVILTGLGVAGTVVTAYLTGRATMKAAQILAEEGMWDRDYHSPDDFTPKKIVNKTWKLYLPPALAGAATIAAIIGANQIGTKRTAALAAAYSLSAKAFDEYQGHVVEKMGEHKERTLRDDIAQEAVNKNPIGNREVIIAGSGSVDCYDKYSDRYFKSSAEEIKQAENRLNHMINNNMYASLNDFYDFVGLPRLDYAEEVGWNSDKLLEVNISTVLSDKMTPCLCIEYVVRPVREYFRLG